MDLEKLEYTKRFLQALSAASRVLTGREPGRGGAEEAPCVVGSPQEGAVPPGEVWISMAPGAGVRLKADGSVLLQGRVEVSGSLAVNGEEVKP